MMHGLFYAQRGDYHRDVPAKAKASTNLTAVSRHLKELFLLHQLGPDVPLLTIRFTAALALRILSGFPVHIYPFTV